MYKAHLVAKGCTLVHGTDFEETFASVTLLTSVKTLIIEGNYSNAFLNG